MADFEVGRAKAIHSGAHSADCYYSMFIGEFLCVIPLLISYHSKQQRQRKLLPGSAVNQASVFTRILARLPLGTGSTAHPNGYAAVGEEEAEEEDELLDEHDDVAMKPDQGDTLSGWRVCWMWFPAFFDSEWALGTHHRFNVPALMSFDNDDHMLMTTRSLRHDTHERWTNPHSCIDLPNVERRVGALGGSPLGRLPP